MISTLRDLGRSGALGHRAVKEAGAAGTADGRGARGRRAAAAALALVVAGQAGCALGPARGEATPLASSDDTCALMREAYGSFPEGTTVSVATPFTGVGAERFDASLEIFTQCTGVEVVQQGSDELEAGLRADVETGRASHAAQEPGAASSSPSAPAAAEPDPDAAVAADLAVVPQPGLVEDLVAAGLVSPLPDSVGANLELGWDRLWTRAGTVDGELYAAPVMASVKSFVWYSPSAFRSAGYEVPRTWEELTALTARIAADHPDGEVAPWCMGLADGPATGWAATDWLEDSLLATRGTAVYDAWAGHEVPLGASTAVQTLDELGSTVLAAQSLSGGREGAASATLEDAAQGLVSGSCLMVHASSSFETSLPEGTLVTDGTEEAVDAATVPGPGHGTTASSAPPEGTASGAGAVESTDPAEAAEIAEVSAFLLPSADGGDVTDRPVLAAGDYLVALNVSEASTAVMNYLTSAQWARERVLLGGVASANRGADVSAVASPVARRASEILQSRQSVIRLDASDAMPSQVGTQALWSAMTSWTREELSSQEALDQAEEAWPEP